MNQHLPSRTGSIGVQMRTRDRFSKGPTLGWLSTSICIAIIAVPFTSSAQPFHPSSSLTSWYTSRSAVDVELFATEGVGNDAHLISPPQVLRLRLERAYLNLLRTDYPRSSIALIGFDLPTGLPSALFQAPPEQVEARGDPIHQLAASEWASRAVNVSLIGSNLASGLDPASSKLKQCEGPRLQGDVFLLDKDRQSSCRIWSLGKGVKYVLHYSDEVVVLLRCKKAPLGCETTIPFEGFAVSISFNESRLSRWREVTDGVVAFLASKQYR